MEEREYWSEANQETGVLQGEEMIQEEKENWRIQDILKNEQKILMSY